MDSNCAETAGGGGALDLTWSTGWAALRAAKLISISWQRWRRDKFLTWDSSKPSVGSRPNPSAGGFYPSVVKFRPLCGLTCWRSTQLFYPIRDSEWFEAPTEREHWPLLNLIDGSDFEILDLIAEGSQQHQATPEYVNKPGCTHLEPKPSNPLILSSDSWTTLLASETMLAKSTGSTPTFTCWVRWSWYWTVCEWWIRASGWPLDSWGMKVEGWEADAELCTRGTGDMACSWSDGLGKRLITWETFRGWFTVETCFVLEDRPPDFGVPDERRLRDEWAVTAPPLTSMDSDDRLKDEEFGSDMIPVPAFYQQKFTCNPVVGHGRGNDMCARFKAPGSLYKEIPKNGQTRANAADNQLVWLTTPQKQQRSQTKAAAPRGSGCNLFSSCLSQK